MGTRERVLTIRLLERLAEHPAYADILGIEVAMGPSRPKSEREGNHL